MRPMPKKLSVPAWARATAEDEEHQKLLRQAANTRSKMNYAEQLASRGYAREQTATQNLALLEAAKQTPDIKANITEEKARLGEAYAEQGKYDKAVRVHPHKTARDAFTEIANAILDDDAKECHCPLPTTRVNGVEVAVPCCFVKGEIYSPKHAAVVPFVVCTTCSFKNASPTARVKGAAQ